MQLSDFLDFDAIKPVLPGRQQARLLQQLAQIAGQRLGLDAGDPLEPASANDWVRPVSARASRFRTARSKD